MTTSRPSNALTDLAERTLTCCADIASYTEEPGQITRTFLCAPMHDTHARLDAWAAALGLQTREDAAGNWRASRRSQQPNARTLVIGSHLDSVPNAGAYDGVLGVVLGLALLDALKDTELPYHVELVGFSEEEGVRFSVPFIGSRALLGTAEELLTVTDAQGKTVAQAITEYGLDVGQLAAAQLREDVLGYLEMHIEQGPVLEAEDRSLAAVNAIAGQSRLNFTFTGKANHAGTTPMHLRRDALAGASAFVLAAENLARNTPGLVATVGALRPLPGASNVIPGEVQFTLDLRHAQDEVREAALAQLLAEAQQLAEARDLTFTHEVRLEEEATPMDPALTELLGEALSQEGHVSTPMVSGAGHDAMLLGHTWPAVMLFLRSPGGLSHHPEEAVREEDVEAALRVGTRFLQLLAEREEAR
ncbi:allantoate amidohydrolase [Deinococcus phoenicis]|uniref:Allantoate amidohydrolase n=1 Tax=Deinococcus phoenicis TaxID=1476583 RepID=A0A016QTD1_9DEIO|nr:allantoate amidohydrolase [Deinococcus phoenicis]EYB69127.1 allantoate amidohydrolase [Deinococcus phoenicis]